MADLPTIIKKQNLVNSLSILELRDILEACSYEMGENPDILPRTPLGAAFHLYPEIFLHYGD